MSLKSCQGMHVDDIAAPTGVDSARLGRSLRFLATQHIFREVEPNVFANNRLSSLLNTGKQAEEIRADRFHKYDGTNGFCALLEDLTSVSHKASTCVWENMADPFTAQSGEPNHSPFQRAFGTNKTYFEWQAEEEQKYISHRFGITMVGMASMRPANAILSAFDWHSLPHDSIVVDVGGGLATSAVPIAKAIPQVKIIVQDLPNVIEHSRKLLSKNHPELLNSGRIELQEHDFFTPQLPLMNASVFMLKQVLHDWSDDHCAKILQYLRDSAMPDAKLLIVDTVLSYALPGTPDGPKSKQTAPAPLLSNFGPADDLPYFMDFGMGAIINGQERTIGQLTDLLHRTGWQIVRVNYESDYYQPVLAVAV
ncbi:O-methyltransferase-domain-containing protein [Mycena capillaripes]|nr:O-methyltransferase-domain-containing protein [Mycena capillaripes]